MLGILAAALYARGTHEPSPPSPAAKTAPVKPTPNAPLRTKPRSTVSAHYPSDSLRVMNRPDPDKSKEFRRLRYKRLGSQLPDLDAAPAVPGELNRIHVYGGLGSVRQTRR